MRLSHSSTLFLVLFLFSALFPGEAAKAQGAATPQFLPVSPWVVGDTGLSKTRGLKNIKLPCVMVNKFNNGFIVRFSGGERKILAMAIDFRQDVFRQGARYDARLSVDGALRAGAKGSAFSPSTLVFNMRDVRGFYDAIAGGALLGIDVEGNKMAFSLSNIGKGLEELESCYNSGMDREAVMEGSPVVNIKTGPGAQNMAPVPVQDPAGAYEAPPAAEMLSAELPSFEAPPESLKEIRAASAMPRPGATRMGAGGGRPDAGGKVWRAQAGEDLKAVLSRWAAQAGTQVEWQASRSGNVVADFNQSGSFEEAVAAILAQNAAASGLQGHMQAGAESRALPETATPVSVTPAPRFPPEGMREAPVMDRGAARWNAAQGSSLRDVLAQWSKRSDVQLIWNAQHGYAVKTDVSQDGSLEAALAALLEPYSGDLDHPAVQFNTDPSTGRRVLIVETNRTF